MEDQKLLAVIEEIALTLERWANDSERGGWSTHQVRPMRDKARDLWAILVKYRQAR